MKPVKTILTAILCLAAFQPAYAQTPTNQPTARQNYNQAYQLPDPRQTIQQGAQQIQAFLATDASTDPAQVSSFLDKNVAPLFDFTAMSRSALGPLNYHVNNEQRQKITVMIQKRFLTALASNLSNYRGGKVTYMNVSGNLRSGRINVRLAIHLPKQYPTIIELRLARGTSDWKIIDVSANGVSAVAHYRNYVRSAAQRSGLESLFQ